MNFDNLMHYDLMTGLYRFIPFLWFCFFDNQSRIHYIAYFNEQKNLKYNQLKQ